MADVDATVNSTNESWTRVFFWTAVFMLFGVPFGAILIPPGPAWMVVTASMYLSLFLLPVIDYFKLRGGVVAMYAAGFIAGVYMGPLIPLVLQAFGR